VYELEEIFLGTLFQNFLLNCVPPAVR